MRMEGEYFRELRHWPAKWNPYQYNGKEFFADIGFDLMPYGARYYDPAVGRFTGVDPIADRFAFVSAYNYAENSPISNIDLHGLQASLSILFHDVTSTPHGHLSKKMGEGLKSSIEFFKTKAEEINNFFNESQGFPNASEFHESGDTREGAGINYFTNSELNTNGILENSEAKEGATVILEEGEIIIPSDAGGAFDDVLAWDNLANGINNVVKGMDNLEAAIENYEENNTSKKSSQKDTIEVNMPNGTIRVFIEPRNEKNNE